MKGVDWYRQDKPCADQGYSTHLITSEAMRLINEQATDSPLFLYVSYNAVHSPYQVPDSYKEQYAKLSKQRQTMAALVSSVDESIGRIVDALKSKGVLDNTLILFSSDNGGVFPGKFTDNTPLRAGKGSVYEGGVRVCAFATWPGNIPAGVRIPEAIHIVDWYPTLLRLAGAALDQPLPIDGKDIWPVLTQEAKSPHDAILIMGRAPHSGSLRMGDWKLVVNPFQQGSDEDGENAKAKGWRDVPENEIVELYNLADDISETNDLAKSNPAKLKELQSRFIDLVKNAVPPPEASQKKMGKNKGPAKTGSEL